MSTIKQLAEYLAETEISPEATRIILDIAAYDLQRSTEIQMASTKSRIDSDTAAMILPTVAPALWTDKAARGRRDPHQFIKFYYREWLQSGLARVHLRALDMPLYYAYSMWETRQPADAERLPRKPPAPGSVEGRTD